MRHLIATAFLFAICLGVKSQGRAGKDYALFFAVSDYEDSRLQNLPQTIENSRSIAEVLEKHYGFQTEVIHNPRLDDIDKVLETYKSRFEQGQLPRDGQLLIFFTGHGVKEYDNGYFLPADADKDRILRTGLSYNTWRPFISQIHCQHILVAVDACYSVTFDPDWGAMSAPDFGRSGEYTEEGRRLSNHKEYNSRLFFTSDSREDIVPGRSTFARKFLEGLSELQHHTPFFTSDMLFADYIDLAQPSPLAGAFEKDDPRSSFLFFPSVGFEADSNQFARRQEDMNAYISIVNDPSIEACQEYLGRFPDGAFRTEVYVRLRDLQDDQEWQFANLKHTLESYRRYLSYFPAGKYVAEARKAVGLLEGEALPAVKNTETQVLAEAKMSFVKEGTFQIGDEYGDSDARPPREVAVKNFYLSPYEVTFEQYDLYCEAMHVEKPDDEGWGRGQRPVVNVSWFDAIKFCNWMSGQLNLKEVYDIGPGGQVEVDQEANGYRLPTEAEWEYAASFTPNGKKAEFGNGRSVADPSEINFDGSESYKEPYSVVGLNRKQTLPVGSLKSANSLGLFDLSGNVREWCWDWYDGDYYKIMPSWSPQGPGSGSRRVVRGGSFEKGPGLVRTYVRGSFPPSQKYKTIGFRLARSGD